MKKDRRLHKCLVVNIVMGDRRVLFGAHLLPQQFVVASDVAEAAGCKYCSCMGLNHEEKTYRKPGLEPLVPQRKLKERERKKRGVGTT